MFLHQLINPSGNEVVIHRRSGLIKVLASSGAVFDAMPLFVGDTSTIAVASELLMQDCWEIASPETAEQAHKAWAMKRWLRMNEAVSKQGAMVAVARQEQAEAATIQRAAPGAHLRLVHNADSE